MHVIQYEKPGKYKDYKKLGRTNNVILYAIVYKIFTMNIQMPILILFEECNIQYSVWKTEQRLGNQENSGNMKINLETSEFIHNYLMVLILNN